MFHENRAINYFDCGKIRPYWTYLVNSTDDLIVSVNLCSSLNLWKVYLNAWLKIACKHFVLNQFSDMTIL